MDTKTLITHIENGTCVIAANKRLARDLRIRYSVHMRNAGHNAWQSPDIISIKGFISRLWEASWPTKQVISAVHERYLYKRVIDDSEVSKTLLSTKPTARLSESAASMVSMFNIDMTDALFDEHDESRAFKSWHESVEAIKSENNLISDHALIAALIDKVDMIHAAIPKSIVLTGFIHLSPSYKQLMDAFKLSDVNVTEAAIIPSLESVSRRLYNTDQEALEDIGASIAAELDGYVSNAEEAPSILILVDNLEDNRSNIEQLMQKHVGAHLKWPSIQEGRVPWEYSHGRPLAEHEIAYSAILALKMSRHTIHINDFTELLLNTRIGNYAAESFKRAQLDYKLRDKGVNSFTLNTLMNIVVNTESYPDDIMSRLKSLTELVKSEATRTVLPSEWVTRLNARLEVLGWPGNASLSSEAYQALESFNEVMLSLAKMDSITGPVSEHDALNILCDLLSDAMYVPRLPYNAPIQISGFWDVAGQRHDKVYAIGMTSDALPRKGSPNPFIPIELQTDAKVPGCSADVEAQISEKLIDELSAMSDSVMFTASHHDKFGYQLSPSPLAGPWPTELIEIKASDTPRNNILDLVVRDELPEPVSDSELITIRGGVSILSACARSPIFAFLQARLRLSRFPGITHGLDPRVQGELVHAAMEYFWGEVETQGNLHSMSDDDKDLLIDKSIDYAFSLPSLHISVRIGNALLSLERRRIKRLIKRWLRHEEQREQPFKVIAREHSVETNIGGLPVKLRIDRIDEVGTGDDKQVLIHDYKTGANVSTKGWNDDMLTEPQLPTYATKASLKLAGIEEVDGICFSQISDGSCKTHILSNWTGNLLNVSSNRQKPCADWIGQLAKWDEQLEALSKTFLDGTLEVNNALNITNDPVTSHITFLIEKE